MSYQVLARKWRPKSFSQLVGQEHVSQALINGLDQDRVHHAFLFTGTRGVGKTTIARILAKCLNCETGVSSKPCGECPSCIDIDEGRFVDMMEIDAASRTKVDDTRELLDSVQYTPTRGRYKVYIIDEVHMLSTSSFNALLKTLEEPPPHVKFVLATTDPQKIPVTILSRCLRFNLRRLLPEQIGDYLKLIVESEKIETEPEALVSISRAADGSMRDGLSLLDQAIAFGGGKLAMTDVENMLGLVDHEHVATMIRALAGEDAETLLAVVQELVSQSRDLETVLLNLAEVLHRVTLVQCVPGYRDPERSDWAAISDLAQLLSAEDAQLFYQIAIKGRNELGLAPDPRTGLEMTLLRMLAFRPACTDSAGSTTGSGPLKARKPAVVKKEPTARSKTAAAKPAVEPAPIEPREPELFSSPCSMPPVEATESSRTADDDWVALQGNLDITGQARELARNVHLQARSEDRWDFVIAPSLRHLGSETCVNRLGQAISKKMGHPVRIKLIDSEGQDIVTAAALDEQKIRQNMSEAEKAISDDPTVKALKEQLGARIVEDSIQPLQ
ncbi:DNA polymerase III subunit gamma/tau [Pseudomonadota bacterium]